MPSTSSTSSSRKHNRAVLTSLALSLLAVAPPADITYVTVRSGVKGKWSAETKKPQIRGLGSLGELAQKATAAVEMKVYHDFVRDAKAFYAAPEFASAGWGYESDMRTAHASQRLISLVGTSYSYSGGAHGIGLTRTYNFGVIGGKPKRLGLADVTAGKSAKRELELRLLEKAMQTPGTDWIEGGEVRDFTPEQLNRFWADAKGLTFEFDPYELGSYASGPFSFKFTWKELAGLIDSKGPLGGLAGQR